MLPFSGLAGPSRARGRVLLQKHLRLPGTAAVWRSRAAPAQREVRVLAGATWPKCPLPGAREAGTVASSS
eukprot:11224696-Lingulodinium_polyedra.AAC.1